MVKFRIQILTFLVFYIFTNLAFSAPVSEYKIKAAFIYNFVKFINFPNNSFKEFKICYWGDNFYDDFKSIIQNKTIKNKKIQIRKISSLSQVKDCNIIFITSFSKEDIQSILKFLEGKPILTIGENENFLKYGGIINFILVNNKIRFEINNKEARKSGFKISSKLLRLAKRVIK